MLLAVGLNWHCLLSAGNRSGAERSGRHSFIIINELKDRGEKNIADYDNCTGGMLG